MAYVGTPTQTGSVRDLLASVIQGEAGNQGTVGMTAVGAVIANRANSNFSGYGSSIQAQLLARNQFQGQAAPTASSYAVADNILSGNYTDPRAGRPHTRTRRNRKRHGRAISVRPTPFKLATTISQTIKMTFHLPPTSPRPHRLRSRQRHVRRRGGHISRVRCFRLAGRCWI